MLSTSSLAFFISATVLAEKLRSSPLTVALVSESPASVISMWTGTLKAWALNTQAETTDATAIESALRDTGAILFMLTP